MRLEEEYGWYYDENLGEESWRRYLRPVPEDRTKVAVAGGRFTMKWRPQTDGSGFLVRAHAGAAHTDLELEGEGGWYYWEPQESEAARTPRPDRPTWIDVSVPDKAQGRRRRSRSSCRRRSAAACCSPPRPTSWSPPSGATCSRAR